MNSSLFFDNKKYISAKEASSITGYTQDYIGQLCRGNKIDSKRIGRVWYVYEDSILNYKNLPAGLEGTFIPSIYPLQAEDQIKKAVKKQEVESVTPEIKEFSSPSLPPAIPKIQSERINKLSSFVSNSSIYFKDKLSLLFGQSLPQRLFPLGLAFVLILVLGTLSLKDIGFFSSPAKSLSSVRNSVFEFGNGVMEKSLTLPEISQMISKAPHKTYFAINELTDFYSSELSSKYLFFGKALIREAHSVSLVTKTFIKNPPFYISELSKSFAVSEKRAIDKGAKLSINFVSTTHQKTFAFLSDSVETLSQKKSYINLLANGKTKILGTKDNSLALVVSPSRSNVVDQSGVVTYRGINSLFDRFVYSPLARLFNAKPTIVNTVYIVRKEAETKNIPKAPITTIVRNNSGAVERIIERVTPSDITRAEVEIRLQELNNKIMSQFAGLSTGSGGNVTNVYQQIAQSQKIDNLSGTTISNSTITGGSISGASVSGASLSGTTLSAGISSLGTTTVTNLVVTNTSTSTYSGGISVTGGCVTVYGTCLGTGSGGGGTPGGSNTQVQFNSSGAFGGSSNFVWNDSGGILGVGTSTATYLLSASSSTAPQLALSAGAGIGQWVFRNAGGNFYLSTTTVSGLSTTTISALEIDGVSGTTTIRGLNISGIATSTSNVGYNITTGCFAISGTCLGGASNLSFTYPLVNTLNTVSLAFGTTTTNNWSNLQSFFGNASSTGLSANYAEFGGTATTTFTQNGYLGIGTTSPWALLSINPNNLGSDVPEFAIGSSSATHFVINGSGSVGIGTTTPFAQLSINPTSSNGASPSFLIGSSTGTLLTVTNGGRVGVGTSSPHGFFSIQNASSSAQNIPLFTVASTTNTGATLTVLSIDNIGGITVRTPVNSSVSTKLMQQWITNLSGAANVAVDSYGGFMVGAHGSSPGFFTNSSYGVSGPSIISNARPGNAGGLGIYYQTTGFASAFSQASGAFSFATAKSGTANTSATFNTVLTITNPGWVGVATTTPQYLLTIASSSAPQLALSAGAGVAQWTLRNAGGDFFLSTTTIAGTATTTISALSIIGATGNVGIGTTTPDYFLKLEKSSSDGVTGTFPGIKVLNTNSTDISFADIMAAATVSGGASEVRVRLFADGLGSAALTGNQVAGSVGTQTNHPLVLTVNNTAKMTIDTAGNVGIGTTSPWGLLSVNPDGLVSGVPEFVVGSSTATHFLVDGSGKVGIGTTTPSSQLTISQDLINIPSNVPLVSLETTGTAVTTKGGLLHLYTNRGQGTDDTDLFKIHSLFNSLTLLTVRNSGNLGVSTSTPWKTLSVVGGVAINGLTDSNTGNYVCLNTTTFELEANTSGCSLSSLRYKTDIQDYTLGIDSLMQLRPVTFYFKEGIGDNGAKKQEGFIAEEVLSVDPILVSIGEDGQPTGLDYPKFAVLLTKAIQEMNLNLLTIASTTATTTPQSETFAASFWGNLFSRIASWLADAENGLTNVVANVFNAKEKICVDGECLTKSDVRALLDMVQSQTANAGSGNGGSSSENGGSGAGDTPPSDTSSPVITIIGNNPAEINIGSDYVDMGATVTDTNADGSVNDNLGIHLNVNGVDVTSVFIDTSTSTTHTIIYSSTDGAGNTGTATRDVIVQ